MNLSALEGSRTSENCSCRSGCVPVGWRGGTGRGRVGRTCWEDVEKGEVEALWGQFQTGLDQLAIKFICGESRYHYGLV